MAKTYYVVALTRPPVLPLPSGSVLLTVNAANATQAVRVANRHLSQAAAEAEGSVISEQEFK